MASNYENITALEQAIAAHKLRKKMIPHITLVGTEDGDWEALYFNGMQHTEGHSVRASDILECLQQQGIITFSDVYGITEDNFPRQLEDVVINTEL